MLFENEQQWVLERSLWERAFLHQVPSPDQGFLEATIERAAFGADLMLSQWRKRWCIETGHVEPASSARSADSGEAKRKAPEINLAPKE